MFEREQSGDGLFLVHISDASNPSDDKVEEFVELARGTGGDILGDMFIHLRQPHPDILIGSGKAQELADACQTLKVDCVIFDHALTPGQERNLEKKLKCRVMDRTGLILDIFASRAHTFEGKLQVELAQLRYFSTRLVRGWTHLERQKGGIGLRGPGETQLELDKRMIRTKMASIERRLEKVRSTRALGRQARARSSLPTVSLVGYTNAGKSTLFNTLAEAEVYEADQLFATLDPTHRLIDCPGLGKLVLVDTVGFIRHLPHNLIDAFRATLEETASADLLLHVVDATDPFPHLRIEQVMAVLEEIGAAGKPMLTIMNKMDALPGGAPESPIDHDSNGGVARVWVSAKNKENISVLLEAMSGYLMKQRITGRLSLGPELARLRARLHERQAVVSETLSPEGGWCIDVNVDAGVMAALCKEARCSLDDLKKDT